MKREMHPEIFILLERRWKPSEIIQLGFSKSTVYKYNVRYKKALEEIKRRSLKH